MSTETQLAALSAKFDAHAEAVMTSLKNAEDYRASTARVLSEVVAAQNDLVRRMNKVEPVADMVTGMRAKMAGALMLLGALGTILWAGATFFHEKIIALLGG